ncbi:hypothetical protein Fmac_000640 [Flemingia macrophylla]|uniref:DhaK domain-containing protein n=1 Tax=Flemingia macrophylla TaxID=520843 RepID=A0ABD1NHK1_9FABA
MEVFQLRSLHRKNSVLPCNREDDKQPTPLQGKLNSATRRLRRLKGNHRRFKFAAGVAAVKCNRHKCFERNLKIETLMLFSRDSEYLAAHQTSVAYASPVTLLRLSWVGEVEVEEVDVVGVRVRGECEPAQAGYVGEGMLTAAICGDIFASPPVDSILVVWFHRIVGGDTSCDWSYRMSSDRHGADTFSVIHSLNLGVDYTGDRLNFGLVAEQAKSKGYKVETVIVGDDCALPPSRGIAGRRGLTGTILVHKHGVVVADLQPADVVVSDVLKQYCLRLLIWNRLSINLLLKEAICQMEEIH